MNGMYIATHDLVHLDDSDQSVLGAADTGGEGGQSVFLAKWCTEGRLTEQSMLLVSDCN